MIKISNGDGDSDNDFYNTSNNSEDDCDIGHSNRGNDDTNKNVINKKQQQQC